tara:strand:+ start:1332 stop:1628 length:297 start_codon:yes stop_codon:yes gene_type:complete
MNETLEEQYQIPPNSIWNHIAKIAIHEDKPIMLDYWIESLKKEVFIGLKSDDEKLLVKNAEEYTSPIAKIYKLDTVFIICTENSLYVVSSNIDKKRVS